MADPTAASRARFTPYSEFALKPRLLGWLIATFIRIYSLTLRIRVEDPGDLTHHRGPLIWAVWHNQLLMLPAAYRRYSKGRKACVLTSPSRDGAVLAAVTRRFGLENVRGSSNKRAAQALVECRRRVLAGLDLAITPDGPRGPVYVVAPGIIQLARLTNCPVVPVRVHYSRFWQLKSWDRFRIPKPFAKVSITFGLVLHVGDGEIGEECRRLAAEMGQPGNPPDGAAGGG